MEQSESRMDKIKRRWAVYVIGLLVVIAAAAWWMLRPPGLPAGFASSNGRIEATEVDIATKTAGRIDTILVKEGSLSARERCWPAWISGCSTNNGWKPPHKSRKRKAIAAAKALLDQRQSEMRASEAVVKQRQAELNSTAKRTSAPAHSRSAARSPLSSWMTTGGGGKRQSGAGIGESPGLCRPRRHRGARTSIIQAQTRVEAAQATERRILADIDDSELKAPRDGRIQYRVAEPEKCWPPAGGC
jgi:HlyD family secretion protein